MKHFRIVKSKVADPSRYQDAKPHLREEGRGQCVYCALPDGRFGGFRNYHVEHYRPKKQFPGLETRYSNLFYACCVCNTFKGDLWPGEYPAEELSFPDPSQVDWAYIFHLDDSGIVRGAGSTGDWLVEVLHLNRPHLIRERKWSRLSKRRESLMRRAYDACGEAIAGGDLEGAKRIVAILKGFSALDEELRRQSIYDEGDLH